MPYQYLRIAKYIGNVYVVYSDYDGEQYFSGTCTECENFINELHTGF